jgi:hypothetical protein
MQVWKPLSIIRYYREDKYLFRPVSYPLSAPSYQAWVLILMSVRSEMQIGPNEDAEGPQDLDLECVGYVWTLLVSSVRWWDQLNGLSLYVVFPMRQDETSPGHRLVSSCLMGWWARLVSFYEPRLTRFEPVRAFPSDSICWEILQRH